MTWRVGAISGVRIQMGVVGHDHRNSQTILPGVIVNAASQHDLAGPLRQDVAELGAEGNEMWSAVTLHVGQVASIELHVWEFCHLCDKDEQTAAQKKSTQFPNKNAMERRTPPSAVRARI